MSFEGSPLLLLSGLAGRVPVFPYQIEQALGRTMGWPALQPNAFANWGMFESGPLTRHFGSEWGPVCTWRRSASGVYLAAHT